MLRKTKNFCLKLAVKIIILWLDIEKEKRSDERKQQWLAESWQHPGFIAYMQDRDKKFRDEMASGIGLNQERYKQVFTQYLENRLLFVKAKNAFQRREKAAEKKVT